LDAALLEKIRSIVGPPGVLTGIDLSPFVVEGRTPDAAVFPGTVDEVAAVVALAGEAGIPVIPWGGGTAAGFGVPPARTGIVLGLRRLAGLVEHEPGDLTATAQAGMPVAALQEALGARGQWLSLDPPDAGRATLGGVIATNASGSRRHLYGTARDLLIGLTVVTAEGAIVRGGGRVVKNVAGYDLPKLFIGALGTLGVVVEVTLKLRPRPDAERLVAARFERLKDAGEVARAVTASDLVPNALDLLDAEASRGLGLPAGGATLVAGFDGLPEQVDWQAEHFRQLATAGGGRDVQSLAAELWARLPEAGPAACETPAAVMRLAVLPAQVADVMEQGASVARGRGLGAAWSAHAGVGVCVGALIAEPGRADVDVIADVLREWRQIARSGGGHAVLERAPLTVKSRVPVWDELGAAERIMRRIKSQLDPRGILNPGRFVGGI
jgi:glycolate oxidase FAD binding subunit